MRAQIHLLIWSGGTDIAGIGQVVKMKVDEQMRKNRGCLLIGK